MELASLLLVYELHCMKHLSDIRNIPDNPCIYRRHLDVPAGDEYIPEFNSLIAFKIPRYHEVTPVQQPAIRWSIFGWILKPGHLYDLQLTSPDDDGGVIECDENDVLSADTCRLAQQILRSCEEQQQQKKGQKQKRKRRKSINY